MVRVQVNICMLYNVQIIVQLFGTVVNLSRTVKSVHSFLDSAEDPNIG